MLTKAPLSRARTIVRTEAGRVQEQANFDAANKAKAAGADVVKQWSAVLDGKTRDTHRELDHQIREMDKPFETHGKKAMYPHDFGDPAEDCNCRCTLLTRARAALDKDELAVMQKRAEFFGLDKTEDFEDFKKKYLKAAETVENAGESGIIETKSSVIKDAISSGKVSKIVNAAKQNRHIRNSASYESERSYLFAETVEEAQRIIDELCGKGEPVFDRNGNWVNKERVKSTSLIGVTVGMDGNKAETHMGMIVYSRTGAHIYPAKEEK